MRLPNEFTTWNGICHAINNSWAGRATNWWVFDRIIEGALVMACAVFFLVCGLFCWGGFLLERLQKLWWGITIRRGK